MLTQLRLIIEGSQAKLKFTCFTGTKVQILPLMRGCQANLREDDLDRN
jgi:hypothetical protein